MLECLNVDTNGILIGVTMLDIKIRSAKENDSKDIFEWRNNELTREMSHTSKTVSYTHLTLPTTPYV